jgi:phosphoribosylamine--glycine ligase
MRILVVGSGAREHALAWRLQRGAGFEVAADREVIVTPGNAGIAREFRCVPLAHAPTYPEALVTTAREVNADLVVIGPEQPLVDGAVDALQAAKIATFGPTKSAARLEGSKAFMKSVCARAGVATASSISTTRLDDARRFIEERARSGKGVVVKADGLCAGKGVVVCTTAKEAVETARDMLGGEGRQPRFGDASRMIVIEDFLPGQELSVFGICDGHDAVLFGAGRDHKRLLDGDKGPNTGGMGAVAPLGDAHGVSSALMQTIHQRVFLPVLDEMRARGAPFHGLLFAGLMLRDGDARVLEFNVRFGDPEAEAILFASNVDVFPLLHASAIGERVPKIDLTAKSDKAAVVVVAAEGYPDGPKKGASIDGLDEAEHVEGVKVFCAGVAKDGDRFVAAGGRVLAVAGRGHSFDEALSRAYAGVDKVKMSGAQLRRDIGASVRGR